MMSSAFYVLLPSVSFAFMVIVTHKGAGRTYLALSWIPTTLFVVIHGFQQFLSFQDLRSSWRVDYVSRHRVDEPDSALTGLVLAVRPYRRREGVVSVFFASCLVIIPFIFRT